MYLITVISCNICNILWLWSRFGEDVTLYPSSSIDRKEGSKPLDPHLDCPQRRLSRHLWVGATKIAATESIPQEGGRLPPHPCVEQGQTARSESPNARQFPWGSGRGWVWSSAMFSREKETITNQNPLDQESWELLYSKNEIPIQATQSHPQTSAKSSWQVLAKIAPAYVSLIRMALLIQSHRASGSGFPCWTNVYHASCPTLVDLQTGSCRSRCIQRWFKWTYPHHLPPTLVEFQRPWSLPDSQICSNSSAQRKWSRLACNGPSWVPSCCSKRTTMENKACKTKGSFNWAHHGTCMHVLHWIHIDINSCTIWNGALTSNDTKCQMLFASCCWILKVLLWSAVLLVAEVDNMYTSLMHLSSCSWAQLKPSITSWCARAMRFKPFDWLNFLSCRSPEPWESTDLGTAVI